MRKDNGRKTVAMIVSCFITSLSLFDTVDRSADMPSLSRSRRVPMMSLILIR